MKIGYVMRSAMARRYTQSFATGGSPPSAAWREESVHVVYAWSHGAYWSEGEGIKAVRFRPLSPCLRPLPLTGPHGQRVAPGRRGKREWPGGGTLSPSAGPLDLQRYSHLPARGAGGVVFAKRPISPGPAMVVCALDRVFSTRVEMRDLLAETKGFRPVSKPGVTWERNRGTATDTR